ncbi:MAG: pseudouridine synthase, partial [Ktedonobacteraceae bacterium]|nr:pseudouridine synthase [Ktedonobacteraceae bacterium]
MSKREDEQDQERLENNDGERLARFLAHAGVTSRR